MDWDHGGHELKLKRIAADYGMSHRVLFLGPRFDQDKEAAYYHAHAFVLPSLSEGVPMAVLEAWSHGLPVVMTPECNLSNGFRNHAALETDASVRGIARTLQVLTEMGDRDLNEMGARGRQLALETYSWNHIARQMKEVYEWVLGEGPRPDCVTCN